MEVRRSVYRSTQVSVWKYAGQLRGDCLLVGKDVSSKSGTSLL